VASFPGLRRRTDLHIQHLAFHRAAVGFEGHHGFPAFAKIEKSRGEGRFDLSDTTGQPGADLQADILVMPADQQTLRRPSSRMTPRSSPIPRSR